MLFVLQEILNQKDRPLQEEVCAMAFGPGLTVEMGLLQAQRTLSQCETKVLAESLIS